MKKEGIALSLIALLIGIIVAGVGFYLYRSIQTNQKQKSKTQITLMPTPSPTPKKELLLSVTTPKDENVTNNKIITVAGSTDPNALVIVSTKFNDIVVNPEKNGDFSTPVTIEEGVNELTINAVLPNGESKRKTITITYSTENF